METDYLLLALLCASFGFALWYALSTSLSLPKSFQIQYDINISYYNRIVRRRLAGFLVYFLIPWWLIVKKDVLGDVSLADLGIRFNWNGRVALWVFLLVPLMILFIWLKSNKRFNLVEYPEMRVRIWTPFLLTVSALSWLLYLFGVEFIFRGLVLHSILMNGGSHWVAILVSAGLYAMIHFYQNNLISLFWLPFGILLAYITIHSGSLLPAIVIQISGAIFNEWVGINKHPEVQFQSRLY